MKKTNKCLNKIKNHYDDRISINFCDNNLKIKNNTMKTFCFYAKKKRFNNDNDTIHTIASIVKNNRFK